MRNKILCLCLSLFMVASYLPASVMTAFAAPIDNLEMNEEDTSPKLILDKESNIKDVFVYKILDGSDYEKDAFGLISYTDSFKKDSESSKEFIEVDDFYSKLLDLFKDIKDLEDVDKKSSADNKDESEKVEKEITQEDINKESLELYDEISKFLDESKQLQFNKDRELTDLTEGVYLIFSENMYPQFINITDSDKDVNIKLEENKESKDSEKVDSNKEEKSTKSSKSLKSSPLRSSSSNTITAFTTSIESGVQSKTIGENELLVLDLTSKTNSKSTLTNSPIMYKVNFTLKGDANFPVGSVSFTIPDHLYKDRNGNYIDTIDMPILEAPATNSKNFNYTHDEENHVYVITNTAELDSAYSAVFNFGYILNDYPSNLMDCINSNNTINENGSSDQFQCTLTVNEESLVETTDKVYINTEIPNWYTYGNNDTKFYKSWPNSWGDKPSDADDYYYLEIKYTPVLSSTYTQNVNVEYTISGLNNSGEIIKMHWGPVSEYTYNNYGSFSGNSDVQDVSTLTGTNLNIKEVSPNYRYNSDQSQSTYTLIRYPKSLLDDGELHNLTYSKDFKWSGVDDTTNIKTKSYNESFNYQKRDFTPPGETFSISKNCDGNSSRTGLERLFNNTNYKISYYSYWTAYAFPHTLKDGGDPTNIDDYGYKKYHSVHIDDYFYISNKNNEYIRLTENEYFIKSVDLQFSAYTYGESNGSYQYTSKTLNSPLNYTLYGKTSINGDWIEIGHSQFNEETNKNEFIYADGEVKTITSSNLNNLSSLPLKRNDIVGVKLDTETNEVGLQTYIDCYTEFKPSNVYNDLLGTEGKYLNFINIASGYIIKPNGEISSYDNSSSTSYMPSYLKNDINTLDDNAYGERIMHDYYTVKTYADYYNVDQGYSKHTYSNDVNNSQVNCNYTLYSYEEPYGDYYSGTTQLYKDGAVRSQTNGTFYNLLPLGFNIDESTINVRTYNNVSDTIYTYELKPNWKNSGRTMLVVNCQTTEDVYNKGFYLDYNGYYSWNAISDYGKTLNNTFAYKTGNNEYGGYSTTYPDNGGDLSSSVKDLFIDVDEDGETTGNHRFYYTTVNDTLNVPTTASISLEKAVKSNNSSDYVAGDNNTEVVTAGKNYSYQIHWGTDDHSTLTNMIVYDNLEAFKPNGVTENWQGIFDSIDLSSPRINGINPVVYYSTQTIDISEDRDLSSSKWSTTMPEDKSQIKAIAIDLSKDNNNNAYTLDINKTISIIINMKAPYNNAQYLEEHNVKAYNSVYLSNRLHASTGTTSDNLDNYEYTELGIETDKVKVSGSKRWLDKDDSNRPDSVVVSLKRNNTKVAEQTVSADTNWSYSFNNLQKYDNSGNEYTYTVDEETNIDNYKKVIKPIDEKGLLIHFDDSTSGNASYINLYYMNNGQYYKSNNLIYDNIKGKTVYVPAETVTIYSKTYGGNSYKVDNIDIIDRNNKLADIIPTYSSSSLSTNPSYIFRGLNYPHYEGDTLITSTDTYVRYIPENIVSYNIYNVLDKTSVKVKKDWDDYNNSANTRPSSINIKLLQNENELNTYSITGPTWEKEITGLDAYDDNLNPYKYTVEEIEVPNYTTSIKTDNSIKITFGEKFATESTKYDYIQLFYERDGQIYKYVGSGSTDDGRFGGAKTDLTSLSNKTIYLPGNKAYIYWHTDGSVFEYGFDVDSITTGISTIPENEVTSTLPNYTITEVQEELPHSERNSSNQYGENINTLWLIDKSDSITPDIDKVIISNKGLLRNISGTKSWNNDTEANRPESVTINLLRNGEKVDEESITASNNWEYEFENLPVYDSNNEKYQYSISEEAVEGYSTLYSNGTDTVSVPTEGYYNIENTWNPRTITITKQWTNSKGGDDSRFRPDTITVHLVKKPTVRLLLKNLFGTNNTVDYRYEAENEYITDNTKWVKNGDTWTYTFAIPDNNFEWQVYEEELDNYNESNLENNPVDIVDNTATITNDFEPVIRIKGEKHWPTGDASYRPENITVNLLRNNQIIDSKVVDSSTEWKYDFGYVPVYDNSRNKYNYSISENNLDDYIYNADTIDTYNSYAIKFGNKFGTYNSSDYLSIYYIDKDNNIKQLTGQGSNSGKWYSTGSYSLADKTIYIPSNKFYIYWRTDGSSVGYGFDINEITPIDIPNNVSITSTSASSLPINESNSINITGSTLPSTNHDYDNNDTKLWKYEGFDSIGDFNITNILNKQSISGTKTWVGDSSENRPESIIVNLYQDGRKIDSQEVTADNNWSYTFTNVPIYKSDGSTKYEYYVEEEPVENYFTNYDKSHAGVRVTFGNDLSITSSNAFMTILYKDSEGTWTRLIGQGSSNNGQWNSSNINSLKNKTIEIPSLEFYITWHGINTSQKWNVTNIEVCDDISIQGQTLGTYSTVEDLKRAYATSTEIEINNDNLPVAPYNSNYEVLYHFNGTNDYKSVNLVNTYNLKNVSGSKTWIGDTASNRPESITLNLYQDGRKIAETTTDASKNWTYIFENVPIYHNDQVTEYEYYVTENPVENYYNVPTRSNTKITFGNTFNTYNSSDYVSIYYKDENDNFKQLTGQGSNAGKWYGSSTYSLAGKSIYLPGNEFYLYFYSNTSFNAYGFEVADIQSVETIDSGVNITSTNISSLPTHTTPIEVVDESTYPKTAHNYSNSMTQMWHYKGVGNGKSLDVVNEYNLFNINGTVHWEGDWNNKSLRPNIVTLELYQNDVLFTTQELTITSDNIQNFEFNNLPRLDENGREYHYVVHQRDIDNYKTSNLDDLNILNECTKRNVTGYKVWVNDKNRNSRPESIKVILYDENNNKIAEKTVTSADEFRENCWKYTFENVDVFDNNGNIKSYHVEEKIDTKEYYTGYIPNYWYRYSSEAQTLLSTSAEDIYKGNVNLPSNILDELFDAFGKYLQDNNIEFPYNSWENLTTEQQEIFTNWTNNYLEDLADQYFDENHLYGYNYDLGNTSTPIDRSIYSESKLAASVGPLRPRMDLTSIVNVYRVKHIDGVKHWEDEGSQYQRPDSVTLGLYRNGEKVDEQVITANNGWEYSFTNLPEVDKDGNPYEYNIKEEDLENYITEYNQGDVTEGVEVTFSLPIENSYYNPNPPIYKLQASNKGYIYSGYSKWEQNNIYNNFSNKYGLVAVFKDGNTWYKMTLEELKSSFNEDKKYSTKAAASASAKPIPVAPSGITFIIPSKEFYIIPVFRYTDDLGGAVELMSTKDMAAISSDNEVPGLVSYKPVKLSKDDKAKLNYVRSVSKVEFPVDPYIDVFDYHMYNRNESGILFEKLGSSFNINDEVEHVIELKEAQLTDFLDEYITDIDTGHDWEVEKWIHNVAYHYKEQLGLTNYPLDAKTSYSGTKIWDENDTPDDDTPDSPPEILSLKARAKASNNLTIKEATRPTQPTSVTVVLLQDGKQYATQTIGEDTDWKFEFNDLPMFDQTDHHKYIYSIKEKSVKGYKSEVTDGGKNGHQVVISSDIYMNLYRNMHILAHYNGNWYDCDSLPSANAYSMINNKIKIYIPGDDFKIIVNGHTITQNEISEKVEYAIEDGNTPENYLTIDNIKAVNIPYEINNDSEGIYYTTLSGYKYFWYQVPQGILEEELSEGNNINITDGSIHSISIDQILEGYDSTNSDNQYSDIFNIYNYTSTNIEGLQIKNTYYEGSFKVKKVDEKGQILPGCEFSLYYADGLTWTKLENDPTAVSISDENGIVTFNNIPYGDYLMYETHPADGYKTPSKPWKVSINTNGSATIWDENGKMVPIEGSDKDYDLSNGVKITFNSETDIPYDYMYILAKNEQTNSAVVYSLRSSFFNSTYSNKSIEIPTKDFYIVFMNEGGGSTKVSSKDIGSKSNSDFAPYGFKVEKVEPIRISWTNIYFNNTYRIMYDSYDYDGKTWDEFMSNSSEIADIIECNNYPESKHYEEFAEYLMKDKATAWHYDATLDSSSSEDYDNDALFEGTIITFGNNNHASVNSESNTEQYYNNPVLLFEYDKQYYIVRLPNNPTELNNLSIKVPSNNIWLQMSGQYRSSSSEVLRSSTVPQTGVDYGYDLGNEIIDVKSIAKTIMTKSDVENALNSAFYQVPKSMESKFTPEFELTAGPQEIHWISDVLGDKDAEESVRYNAFYHYQNDASGLIPKYEIPNELTRTETILVNTEDEPIPDGILQIIDKDGNVVDSWSTTEENHITLGLTEGEEYTIHQESTPYPYRVASDDTFEVLTGETTYVKVINDKVKDVTISKTVSGSGANTNDVFNYHVTITNGEHNINHIVETPNGNLTLTTDNTGSGSLDFTMKHNESVKIKGVYKDAIVTVTESANKYVASYQVDNGTRTINPTNNMDLTSTITMGDNDVSIAFENTLTMILPTGVYLTLMDILPFIMLGLCLAGMAVVYRKNKIKKINLVK